MPKGLVNGHAGGPVRELLVHLIAMASEPEVLLPLALAELALVPEPSLPSASLELVLASLKEKLPDAQGMTQCFPYTVVQLLFLLTNALGDFLQSLCRGLSRSDHAQHLGRPGEPPTQLERLFGRLNVKHALYDIWNNPSRGSHPAGADRSGMRGVPVEKREAAPVKSVSSSRTHGL
jgi:hypothetical protein